MDQKSYNFNLESNHFITIYLSQVLHKIDVLNDEEIINYFL